MDAEQPRPFRLLVLTSTFPRWFGDTQPPFVYDLSRRLGASMDVTVLAPHTSGAAVRERMENMCVRRFRYAPGKMERLAYDGGMLAQLKGRPLKALLVPVFFAVELVSTSFLLRRHRFNAIHAHWLLPQGLCAILACITLRRRPRIVCTAHGADLYALRGRLGRLLKRFVLGRCDAVTVVSSAMKRAAVTAGADPARVAVAPMGVDLAGRFTPPTGAAARTRDSILFVGRLVSKKGLEFLLMAMPGIIARRPAARLTVAGSGPLDDGLRTCASRLGIAHRVDFLGGVPQASLPDLYRRHAVVAFPSVVSSDGDQEGFGLVLVEALGCGTAVVCTDLPAMRDIVQHEVSGLVVPQKDADGLSNAIVRLLDNDTLRHRLAETGRSHVLSRFAWDSVTQNYLAILSPEPSAPQRAYGK